MSTPESAAGGAQTTPAELVIARLPLLEKRIGELVADAGDDAWRLVPDNGGAIGTAYGRGTSGVEGEGALVVVKKWHHLGATPTKMAKYAMQVLGESPTVSWFQGTVTADELQFDHPEKNKPLHPDFSKALLISTLVLSAESAEPPVPVSPRKAVAWLGKMWWKGMKALGEGDNGAGYGGYPPFHI